MTLAQTVLFEPAISSSILALVTTVHFGLALLRNHRSTSGDGISPFTAVSLAFAATPWLLPSLVGLALGLVLHIVWFTACEVLAPSSASTSAPPAPGSTQKPAPQVAKSQQVASGAAVQASRGFAQTPVLAVVQESDDIKTIRLQRPEGFHFKPGQFLPVRIRVDGKEHVRCYSISSSPSSEGFLEISVKRQGLVSNALHATARPGSILTVKAPNGHFTYPADDDRPIVLIAGGIGITPLISMLRHAVHAEPSRRVTLIYSAHDRRGLAFFDELALLSSRHPQVRTIFALTREAPPEPAFYPGRIDRELLHTTVPDIRDAISLMCGPTQMIDAMKALLTDLAVPTDQIRYELFEAAVAASTGPSPEGPRRSAAVSPTAGGSATDSSCAMHCLPGNETVAVAAGQTILEAAEGHGVDLPSLCRAGVCGTCRVRVTEGKVDCDTTTLDASELSQGYVLACVATPRTNCTVQL